MTERSAIRQFFQSKWHACQDYVSDKINKAKKRFEDFSLIMEEGHFHSYYKSPLYKLFNQTGRKNKLESPTTVIGSKVLRGIAYGAEKYFWVGVGVLALMFLKVSLVTGSLVALGASHFVHKEYKRAQRKRLEEITVINFAGQKVRGMRADLYHLDRAQRQILDEEALYFQSSGGYVQDMLKKVYKDAEERSQRVFIIDKGPNPGASDKVYSFSKRRYKMVDDMSLEHVRDASASNDLTAAPSNDLTALPSNDNAWVNADLKPSWDKVKDKARAIETVIALQELPEAAQQDIGNRIAEHKKTANLP